MIRDVLHIAAEIPEYEVWKCSYVIYVTVRSSTALTAENCENSWIMSLLWVGADSVKGKRVNMKKRSVAICDG